MDWYSIANTPMFLGGGAILLVPVSVLLNTSSTPILVLAFTMLIVLPPLMTILQSMTIVGLLVVPTIPVPPPALLNGVLILSMYPSVRVVMMAVTIQSVLG